MKWNKVENYGTMSRYGAEQLFSVISARLAAGKEANIGLATGNTMIKLYGILAGMLNQSGLNLEKLFTFNLDEYVGDDGKNLGFEHPLSYCRYMSENFFDLLDPGSGFKKTNMFFPDAANPADYDFMIKERGLAIQLLGIGFNGHIAFNEPISEVEISQQDFAALPSRIIELDKLTIRTNARLTAGNDSAKVPRKAVTMGMASILQAEKIILLACFPEQAEPLSIIKAGKITSEIPASFLLNHKMTEIIYTQDKIKL